MSLRAKALLFAWILAGAVIFARARVAEAAEPVASDPNSVTAPGDVPAEPGSAVDTFEAAWRILRDSYFDPTFHGLDWNAVRTELLPKARAAQDTAQLRKVIQEMLDRLGGSHMALIPGSVARSFEHLRPDVVASAADAGQPAVDAKPNEAGPGAHETTRPGSREGDVGMEIRWLEGRAVVTRVDSGGPSAHAGIRPGWILEAIDNEDLQEAVKALPAALKSGSFVAWTLIEGKLRGRPGSDVSVRLLDATDHPVSLTLQRQRPQGEPTKLGYLPTLYARLESERLDSANGGLVGLIRFNLWLVPVAKALDERIDEFRNAQGIILDLRGNLGGIGGMILGISGHFLKDRVSLGTMQMRGNELQFFANPRRVNPSGRRVEPYGGPLAILVDGISLSAAEIFAGGMQALGRARIFGEPSGGQALPAIWDRLPNGDVLYHAFGDFVTANGTRLEGRGVLPDELVPTVREDLLAGRDAPVRAALRWIALENAKRPKPTLKPDGEQHE